MSKKDDVKKLVKLVALNTICNDGKTYYPGDIIEVAKDVAESLLKQEVATDFNNEVSLDHIMIEELNIS